MLKISRLALQGHLPRHSFGPLFTSRNFSATAAAAGLNVLFYGTDEFGARVLKSLIENRNEPNPIIDELAVICPETVYHNKKKKKGKPVVVWQANTEKLSKKHNINVYHPIKGPAFKNAWTPPGLDGEGTGNVRPFDIGVVASYGVFIPSAIINMHPKGMINVHPSLLPKYRGPSPIQTAILDGETDTGVTIQELHPRIMDGGRILAQAPYKMNPGIKYDQMALELAGVGGELLLKVLENLDFVRKNSVEQDILKETSTYLFHKQSSQIYWETMTADDIFKKHCAFYTKEPVYTYLRIKNKNHMVQFMEMTKPDPSVPPIDPNYLESPPGTVFFKKKVPYIELHCIDGSRIHVTRFKVSGKAERDTFQFSAGYRDKKRGSRFISVGACTKRPTPPFQYPEGYVKPVINEKWAEVSETLTDQK
ncbi:Methionyl-tRNA formyltransferase [Coemansia sp. RSA 1286]|nr:Methionyl-tRNA formyltransferase [Coemansia sp. RSA 1286]